MKSILLKAIWFLIHTLVNIIESLYYFGLEFRENFINFIKNSMRSRKLYSKDDENLLIARRIHELKRLPKHIAVILHINNEEDVDLLNLAKLVSWSLNSGVNFISFYDYKGILKHQLSSSFYEIIQRQLDIGDNENIVWGLNYQSPSEDGSIKFPHRNGYKRHIVINLYSSQDSYGKFNQLLQNDLCNKTKLTGNSNSKDITIDTVNEKLNKLYGNMPEPELALYFGNNTCTAGFLPWHIRLTEFIQISYKVHHLSLEKYIRVLYKYAKCEQRYGK